MFEDFDLKNFLEPARDYTGPAATPRMIGETEVALGYRLPDSYLALIKCCNGGIPKRTCFPTKTPTSWAADHVAISGLMGVGSDARYALCGSMGSAFMIEEWGYPPIGVAICDCPSAGHDMIFLDYRSCGRTGEPAVVHVDQELDYAITPLAPNFEAFLRGLRDEKEYE